MDLRYKTKDRVALKECRLTKHQKSCLLKEGIAQKIFVGSGEHAYNLFISKKDRERLGIELK